MNVVLLVVDSLRAQSLGSQNGNGPRTPFLEGLVAQTVAFRRAYATECWTLPTHCSIFTGLLPSEHGAHFQTMAYRQSAPTLAELLAAAGFHTEIVTRNFVFDGTMPGVTRGFRHNRLVLSAAGALNPFALFLAFAKPRFRRHLEATGFFHPLQRESRQFLATFARAMMPADRPALASVLEQMTRLSRQGTPYFLFSNLYDVHAPYPPTPTSILRPFRSPRACLENVMFPYVMSHLGAHKYLRPGFRVSALGRQLLLDRYHRAIELMDAKLAEFYGAARSAGLLDDTLLIITSDHGEAFGEHHLFLHDASVYDTHLHVPLWIHHPDCPPGAVEDVVSTRDLFGLIRAVALGEGLGGTLLDPRYRSEHPIALAEHFHYPHAAGMDPRYKQNIAAAIAGRRKIILRSSGPESYDLARDPYERNPGPTALAEFEAACRADGVPAAALSSALEHLRRWTTRPVHVESH